MSGQQPNLGVYLTQTRRLLKDPTGAIYSTSDLTDYINESRTQLALDSECVRFFYQYVDSQKFTINAAHGLTTSNVITGLPNTNGVSVGQLVTVGSNYPTNTTVAAVTSNTVTTSQPPLANYGPATATFTPVFQTISQQEIYPYPSEANTTLGYFQIVQVRNISVNWGGIGGSNNYRLRKLSFTQYNAFLGFYGPNLVAQPAAWADYETSVFIRPIPSGAYPMQWDTICTPIDLVDSTTPEVIPYAWTDGVKYYAAHLAFLNAQRKDDADRMEQKYNNIIRLARKYKASAIVPNVYA